LDDDEKDLIKLSNLIFVSQVKDPSTTQDNSFLQLKHKEKELKNSIHALRTVLDNSEKDTKDNFKTLIKQAKDEIKQLEKKQKGKNTDSGIISKGGGSDFETREAICGYCGMVVNRKARRRKK